MSTKLDRKDITYCTVITKNESFINIYIYLLRFTNDRFWMYLIVNRYKSLLFSHITLSNPLICIYLILVLVIVNNSSSKYPLFIKHIKSFI
ncbi:uncharacterized protein Smp_204000 [Schistosoma mansoni]|uniref:uncharacterized protein n=1 Tax=Schistosoma mansoni TaxID=6183 RepID=UPI00022DCBE7|nr:uncharacterized protein Smp_204000 [Schistosoma mansoni]|eukprot:XP_018655507.1 uncharacterized protein Smp_204000 [Schistosoma mansoni]